MRQAIGRRGSPASLLTCMLAALLLTLPATAQAIPFHARAKSLDITTGLNHACGVAVDSKGDLYASSAGESKIKVYNPSHTLLTEISDVNTPCGLAVTTTGNLYVSERATGKVVRFKPNAYPFAGTPTYGSAEAIDESGKAKGIAVDPVDNRLYVAEGDHVAVYKADGTFEANVGGTLTEASGVAAYTYSNGTTTDRYLWVADASGIAADKLVLFTELEGKGLELRRELKGVATPYGSFGFGTAGAYLVADPGNRKEGKCAAVAEQACSAGDFFLYDAAHEALEEFDASGEYLDQTKNAGFADAEPTAIAIDRSGAANDGTIYVTAGSGAGAKALAFAPLKAPSRKTLKELSQEPVGGLSHILAKTVAVTTDSHGDAYALANGNIRVFGSDGKEIVKVTKEKDELAPSDIAVDSTGKVYVLDQELEIEGTEFIAGVTYYTPSQYPPTAATTYTRQPSAIVTAKAFPKGGNLLRAIAVNPGPGPGKDQLFVLSNSFTRRYDSAAKGSTQLDAEFAICVPGTTHLSIAVNGVNGTVYISANSIGIYAVNEAGTKCLLRFDAKGSPSAKAIANPLYGVNPVLAVDQSNGHVIAFDGATAAAREYDAAGSFLAEFGELTEEILVPGYRVAVDSACAIHEPPLTGAACEAFDPANGTAYVAFDDTKNTKPPFDVNAFGPLRYPDPVKHKLTVVKEGSGSGKVTSSPSGIECSPKCAAEFDETEAVVLKAIPDPESEFVGWGEEDCEAETVSPAEGTCKVTMDEDRKVTAEFKSIKTLKTLKVVVKGSGRVTGPGIDCPGDCVAEFGIDVEVLLSASASPGSEFVGWSGCDSEPSTTECKVTMSGDREVTAEFGVEHPLLTVVEAGGGTGTVTSEPPGIDCPSDCEEQFDLDDEVTLKAEADPGSQFEGWSGCDSEPEPEPGVTECEVTMEGPRQVTATFAALPQAIAKQAHPVMYDEATLRGEVNPMGSPTEYRFEYLTEEEYEANDEAFDGAGKTPVAKLGPEKAFALVEAQLLGLEEGTEYRFVLRAVNSVGSAEDEGTFTTLRRRAPQSCPNAEYRFGLSANLPDCRAYELVTPAETNGLIPYASNNATTPSGAFSNWLTVQRGEAAGERVSYFTAGTLPGFDGNGILDAYRAERGEGDHPAGGWQNVLFSPDYEEAAPGIHGSPFQLGVASSQLYSSWENNPEPEAFPGTLPHGVYLRTPSGFETLARGDNGEDLEALSLYLGTEGAHVIFSSSAQLEDDAPPVGNVALYDRAAGSKTATVVSTPPAGASPSVKAEFESNNASFAGYAGATEDGAAVAFTVGGTLYLHRAGETVEIATAPNTFAGISSDGYGVFYTATTTGSSPAPLYSCDTHTGPCAGPGAHSPAEIAAAGIFALVSPDGTHAFFSSAEVLTGEEENENEEAAEPGAHNLYAWDGTATRFVGGLPAADFKQSAFAGISGMNLAAWTEALSFNASGTMIRLLAPTRSTPDGSVFVFQSHARLTSYDNDGVGEIYRYDPAAEAGERLLCVSCDPTGASPSADALLEDARQTGDVPLTLTTMVAGLTDNGQEVFFQSFDRLLPEDANEVEDVYEWEANETGGCARPGGCLALISSGQGETPSFLYAMSASGDDVFIQTREKLAGVDTEGSPSLYDVRAGGGIPEPSPPAPCQGDACQGQGSEPPVLPSPATTGLGESPKAQSPARKPCAKGKHRVKGRCVPAKRRKHRHHRAHSDKGGKR